MVRTVEHLDPEIDQRISGEHAAHRRFLDSAVHGRDVLPRNRAADDLVDELVAGAARLRREPHPAVAELATSAGLFLVAALALGLCLDRLAIGDPRLRQLGRHAELSLELRHVRPRDAARRGPTRSSRASRRCSAPRTSGLRRAAGADPAGASLRRRGSRACTAIWIAPSGNAISGRRTGCWRVDSVSFVCVLRSFATQPMSPAWSAGSRCALSPARRRGG